MPVSDAKRTDGEPHSRLTRISDTMLDAMTAHPEYREGDRAIVALSDDGKGGLGFHGYDDAAGAERDLLAHLKAVWEVQGKAVIVTRQSGN